MILRFVIAAAAICGVGFGQVATEVNKTYQSPEGRQALVGTLTAGSRDATQKPRELVAVLGVKPGMTVADVGTGPGYMLPYLSAAVGDGGKVVAEDIFDDFLGKARAAAAQAGLKNVSFIKGTEHSAELPSGGVDLILALDSYHHYNYPADMLAGFKKALKPGGRLAIVEYYKRSGAIGGDDRALTHIRLDDSGVIKEVEAAGFALVEERETIPKSQYLCLFRVK